MPNEQQWVAFRVAEQAYGLPIAAVREIVRAPEITPVPQSPEHVAGVSNLRGRIIPVVDVRKKLGVAAPAKVSGNSGQLSDPDPRNLTADSRKTRVLVLSVDGKFIGLLVDEANEVLKIAPAEIEASPKLPGDHSESYLAGIAKHQGRLVILLDPGKLLANEIAPEAALA